MRKMLCFLLIMMLSISFVPTVIAQETVVYGDVNADGNINAKDALLVLKYAVNKEQFTALQLQAANVTKQETPNAKDALDILQKSVGKRQHFEVEKTLITWRQPTENGRVRVSYQEFAVQICNTYQQFQDVLQIESLPYSAEYFETGRLVVVTLSTPHTGYSHYLKDLYVANDTLYMKWDLKCPKNGVAAHIVDTWHYFIEVNQPIPKINGAVAQIAQYTFNADGEEHVLKVYEQAADII